jgi:hypothetical protein
MAGTSPDRRDVTVEVLAPEPEPTATPEPLPTVAPEPPVIGDFSADRGSIYAGECVYLRWGVGGLTDVVQLYRNGQYLFDVGVDDGRQECFDDPGSYTYRLRAANSAGLEDSRELSIYVESLPGPLPPDPDPEPGPQPEPEPQPEPDPEEPVFDDLGG